MKYIFPIILIAAAIGLFFLYVNPTYSAVKDLRTQSASYNDALNNAEKLQAVRDTLVAKYNSLTADELDRLTKLLPDNVDNIKLILEISQVASQYGMQITNIKYDIPTASTPAAGQVVAASTVPAAAQKDYGSFDLEFSVSGPYGQFISFLSSLEKSLRIVDIDSVSFSATAADTSGISGGAAPTDSYKYDVKITTYWLKG